MITTCMVSLVAIIIWRIPPLLVLFFFLMFGALDGVYMSSALRKVPDGAWFTLLLAVILSTIFVLWRWGKEQQWAAEAEDRIAPSQLLQLSRSPSSEAATSSSSQGPPQITLTATFGGGNISTAAGLGIFFDKVGGGGNAIPKVFTQFIRKFKARPEVTVFFHMRPLSLPTVPAAQRFVITRINPLMPSCYRLTLRHGYMDDVLTPDLGRAIVHELMLFITRSGATDKETAHEDLPPVVREEVNALSRARDAQMVYVMGKQVMRTRAESGNILRRVWRRVALEAFLWIRENSRTKLADLDIDFDNLIEVGFVKEL